MTLNMDGPKRIQLTTVATPGKQDKNGLTKVTVRFDLDLTESTDSACPEFFYPDLLKTQPDADRKSSNDDPFGEDHDNDKLAAIAKAFEDKYNKPVDGKKKKKVQGMDYMYELGDGYDENDTFIDNSEAFDEILPYEMTTKLGGFYINSGKLDFKELSEDSEEEFIQKSVKKNKKKRRISSDDESGEEKVVKKKKIKDSLTVDGEVKKKKKKKLQLDGEKPFKKPKQPQDKDKQKKKKSASVAALLKSTSPNLNGEGPENGRLSPSIDSGDSNESDGNVKSSVTEAIDAVVSMATRDEANGDFLEDQKKEIDPENIPKLPPNLNSDMEAKLDELKKQAQVSRDGKCKFFTPSVNKLLLDVEMSSKGMSVSNRSAMYGHLAAFLPCSKETLLKRAKTLRVKELEDKIKEPIEKLRQVVNRMMPDLLEKFEAECKKHALERAEEGNKPEVGKESGKEEANTESDDEEKTGQSTDSTKKRVVGPRKKFPWDNNIRNLLNDVVRVKMHTFQMSKTRSQTAEEFCKTFLDQDIRPLWPKGWMQTRVLYKESKPAHALWTNPQKSKKPMMITKSPNSSLASSGVKVSPAVTTQASMNGTKVCVVSVTKVTTSVKSSPVYVSNTKSGSNSVTTPSVTAPKKIVPTLLDYTDKRPGANSSVKVVSTAKTVPLSGVVNLTMNSNLKTQTESKLSTKEGGEWDHIVSDILRSSLGEQLMKSASPAPSNKLKESSFHSQFENFTANLLSQGITGQKAGSPNQQITNQLKTLQQLQQKKQQLQQVAAKAQSAGPKPQVSNSGVKMQTGNLPKLPSQSPMSLAMAKSITSGQSGQKVTPKQLVNQFSKEPPQTISLLTADNMIQKQLSACKSSPPSSVLLQTRAPSKSGQPLVSSNFGHVTSSTDVLRKTSPQSQAVNLKAHITSQVKPSQVIKVQTSASQNNAQGPVFHKTGNLVVTTDNKMTTTLLKTLFATQAQSNIHRTTTSSDTGIQPQTLLQARGAGQTSPKQVQPQWSPSSSKPSQPGRTDTHSKPYVVPVTSSRPVPGYQSVKLSNLTAEQMANFNAAPQAHRNPESGIFGNQIVSRPSTGSLSSRINPEQHRYNALHYGYHGYQDGAK